MRREVGHHRSHRRRGATSFRLDGYEPFSSLLKAAPELGPL
ncbi:MAG: hypothetical protein ABIG94_13355 [Pseudomonadota bacterium]